MTEDWKGMTEDTPEVRPDIEPNEIDTVVSAWSGVIGSVPGIGPVVAELVRYTIPNQRLDRMADFVRILDDKVSVLERSVLEEKMRTPQFVDLFEDGAYQAVTSASDKRREYIAALLKNSLTSEELSHEQEKKLLALLAQLNDSELVILSYYGTGMLGEEANDYFRRHEDVLRPPIIETGMSDEEARDNMLKQAYRDNLRLLGLARTGSRRTDQITPVGRLLLQHIDFYSLT